MLITFSGLDGSGKSTLIGWLKAELERDRRPVTVLHQNDHVGLYACARAVRDRVFPGAAHSGPPRIERHPAGLPRLRDTIVWSKTIRRLLYPVDVLIFLGYRLVVEVLRRRVLIMDRYFYDTLVDVADPRSWSWLRLLARLTPTPDLAVLLEVPSETAYARKGEYTVPYLRRREQAYRKVFPWVPKAVRVPAAELDDAKRRIARVVRERGVR